jgi:hypothetical protein
MEPAECVTAMSGFEVEFALRVRHYKAEREASYGGTETDTAKWTHCNAPLNWCVTTYLDYRLSRSSIVRLTHPTRVIYKHTLTTLLQNIQGLYLFRQPC